MMIADVSSYIDVSALVKILLIALVAGAGLTALFSLGVLGLSKGGFEPDNEDGTTTARNNGSLVLAGVCFLIVLAGIGYGISVALTK
jgi:hypothetical protein